MRRRSIVWIAVAAAVGVAVAVALAVFEPWQLFVDDVVSEEIPEASPAPRPTTAAEPPAGSTTTTTTTAPAGPILLARGTFISHEHATSGTVEVIEVAAGHRVLALRGLNTSNGPDLHVWLTDAPVIDGRDGWHVFDDGLYVSLGPLKGNIGDQVYDIPADVDLGLYTSVTVWCDRFDVSFGAATLQMV
jgi:hypothetical protein